MALVTQHVLTPVGGRLAHFVENWREISSDPWVLGTVTGSTIDFHATPIQYKPLVVDAAKTEIVSREVRELSAKKATIRAPRDSEGFSSSLFLVPNANGFWRPVLNLKPLNRFVASQRFKMESAQTVKNRETI